MLKFETKSRKIENYPLWSESDLSRKMLISLIRLCEVWVYVGANSKICHAVCAPHAKWLKKVKNKKTTAKMCVGNFQQEKN